MNKKIFLKLSYRQPEQIQHLHKLLTGFGNPNNIDVVCIPSEIDADYSDLVLNALHEKPLDIAELGTSMARNFITKGGLRPFQAGELHQLGGEEAFLPFMWNTGVFEEKVWSIPWVSDVRLVFYRRDMLSNAGVDEQGAFETPERFEQTLYQLKKSGVTIPWSVPSNRGLMTIQNLSSWVWYHQGKFIDEATKKVCIDQPETIAGLQEYFRLYRYLGPTWQNASLTKAYQVFVDKQAAVTICGPWLFEFIQEDPELFANVGVALPLKQAFVGGSCLAIWKKSLEGQATFEVLCYLTGDEFQSRHTQVIGLLPAKLEALNKFSFPNDTIRETVLLALKTGHELPSFSLWGLIENRLATSLAKLWLDILNASEPNVDEMVTKQMSLTTQRLNTLLEQH